MKLRNGTDVKVTRMISPAKLAPARPQQDVQRPATLPLPSLALQPDSGLDVWISARQAREILGVRGAAIYRLTNPAQPYLLSKRPLPRKVLISLRSVTALAEATKDPKFWTSPGLQEAHRVKLKGIADNLGLKMVA